MAKISYEEKIKALMVREPHLTYLEASKAIVRPFKIVNKANNKCKKPKKTDLQRFDNQLNDLFKALAISKSDESAARIKNKIKELKIKIQIAKCNKLSKLNSIRANITSGGLPGLGKRK